VNFLQNLKNLLNLEEPVTTRK